ncbi:MAG: acyl-CoA reductase [Bacteroidetes bacterium]|nr:acyl-CoA reductase [Bacteroidota bacterium]
MTEKLTDIEFLFPREPGMDNLIHIPGEEPFSENAIAYLDALAHILNKDPGAKNYPEVATFAFFCRKGNLLKLKKKWLSENSLRLGRGLVFHITPSNMPVTFAWSLVFGILSGNVNIVKVSSKKYAQADIICHAIYELSKEPEHQRFSARHVLVSYNAESSASTYFSSICDVRIIWGGNATIDEVRKNKLPPHSFDVTFADRYSLCVINADKFNDEKAPEQVASGFYNDTYLFDQNACSSPHLIVWLGADENVETAKRKFWKIVYDLAKARYNFQPHSAVDKLTTFYYQAVQSEGIKKADMPDNLIWRTELKAVSKDIDKYRCYGGYFSEYKASSLKELANVFSNKFQTLSYYGIEKEVLIRFITQLKPIGIDRIVPIGKTADFSLLHDGFNLIDTLSREIELI